MKRFITEFANYKKKTYQNNELMKNEYKDKSIQKIDQALKLSERGLITINETMKIILEA